MPIIKCLSIVKGTRLESSFAGVTDKITVSQQREMALKVALDYHKGLHNELENLKKSINKKHVKAKYVAPDFTAQAQRIKDRETANETVKTKEATDFALSEVKKGAINWDNDMLTPRPELGMEWKDIRKGKQDLIDGKDTPASKRLVEAINKAKEDGGYNFIQGSGKLTNRIFVPIDYDIKQATDLTKEELKYVAENEQKHYDDYNEWLNSLTEKEFNDELNSIENGKQNKESGAVNEQTTDSKTNVSNTENVKSEGENVKQTDENRTVKALSTEKVEDITDNQVDTEIEALQKMLEGDGLDKVITVTAENTMKLTPKSQSYIDRVMPTLKALFPNTKITIYDTTDAYVNAEGRSRESAGVYNRENNSIGLNMELINEYGAENTVFHEAIHPIVDAVYKDNPKARKDAVAKINELAGIDGMEKVREHTDLYQGEPQETIEIEAITEFLSLVADNKIDVKSLNTSNFTKVKEVFNDLLKAMGIKYQLSTAEDVVSLSKAIKQAFESKDPAALTRMLSGKDLSPKSGKSVDAITRAEVEARLAELKAEKQKREGIKEKEQTKSAEELIKEVGLTKEDVQALRDELGEKQFEQDVRSNAERIAEAKQMIEDGYNTKGLIKKVQGDYLPSPNEVEILKQYYSALTEAIEKNPTPELLKERIDFLKTIDATKVQQGRSIQAWDGLTKLEDNLANFLTEESQFIDLSDQQIKDLSEKYAKAKEVIAKLEKMQQEALNKGRDKKAISEIEKAKKTGDKKLVGEAYKNERSKIKQDFWSELKKIRSTPNVVVLPYARETIVLADFARKMMKSYVSEGIYDLKTIVDNIYGDVKSEFPEIDKNDVRDMLAGEYRDPTKTKNYKLSQIRDLQTQAKLERQIEKLENGILERKPAQRRVVNDEIDALREKIKEIKKRNPELTAPSKMDARKTWLSNRIAEIKEEIRKGNFEPIEEPTPILLDAEALKLKDEYIKFKEETRARRQHQQEQSFSKIDKAIRFLQELSATKRLVQTSIDLSIPLRQGISVMLNPRTIGIGRRAYSEMISSVKSEKNYDRMMFDIEQSPKYLESKDDGIVYAEVGSLNNEKRDEYHRDHFLYKAPVLGDMLRTSERAAAAWTNYARYELYLRGVKLLEAQGKTRANSKQAYEDMSARVMVDTGRGKIPFVNDKNANETDGRIKRLLGNTLYGARLASAIFRKLNPVYYLNPKVDQTVRVQALKDMAGYVTGLVAVAAIASLRGYTVSFDWDDPDYLKLRRGKEVIDITGGMATYVRTFMRLVSAAYKQFDPSVSHDDAKKYAGFAGKSLGNFWRNKLAPNTSYGVNAFFGENAIGEKFDPWEIIKIYPMYTDDIIKSFKEGSPLDLATIIPLSISGLGYMTYEKDIRKANLNEYLDTEKDKSLISFLKSKQLNLSSSVNQEVYDVEKGGKFKMTTSQHDKYEKLWSDFLIDELKADKVELSKLSNEKLNKKVNSIKLLANKYAKTEIMGVAEGVDTIRDDDKVYQLTPEQVKQRVALIREYIKEDGDNFMNSIKNNMIEEGESVKQAIRKAKVKMLSEANEYSRNVMIDEDKENNDGKVTFKEKPEKL